ncbi:Acetylornithine deacetylase [hydrothermal vent metagenome]|uniref:Acetylornithine deacetylase n=1 Tax=hydrothermal vent metagenome TaxID=652676 RepID=A0A3B1DSN3_9ZZZZ
MNAFEYTSQLVAFDSVSRVSNVEVSNYAEEQLKQLGFMTERVEYQDENGLSKVNIIAKKGEGLGGMAYFCHTDVVPADTWFFEEHGPFEPTVIEDRLYARGSCDMKGSLACMLEAAGQFDAKELKHPIYITCTADEEIGYYGANEVVKHSKLYREMVQGEVNGIIGEPTMLEVVYAHKGTFGFRAISRGKAAHSSTTHGLNANLAMIPFLAEMKKIHDETMIDPQWQNDEFDPPTISWNIGINDHTSAINITPPQSVCTVYFRPMPGQNVQLLMERARNKAEECGIEFHAKIEATPIYVDPKSPFVQEVLQIANKTTPRTVAYGTDGNAFFREIKKLVVFGPGDIAQAHTHDEFISLEQLELGTQMYANLIRHWCT